MFRIPALSERWLVPAIALVSALLAVSVGFGLYAQKQLKEIARQPNRHKDLYWLPARMELETERLAGELSAALEGDPAARPRRWAGIVASRYNDLVSPDYGASTALVKVSGYRALDAEMGDFVVRLKTDIADRDGQRRLLDKIRLLRPNLARFVVAARELEKQYNDRIEDKIEQLTDWLVVFLVLSPLLLMVLFVMLAAKWRAHISDRQARETFAGALSHDLKSPLQTLLVNMDMLTEKVKLDKSAGRYADRIIASGNHLLALCDGIIAAVEIQAGKVSVTPEPSDIAAIVDDVRSAHVLAAERKGVALRVEGQAPPLLLLDGKQVRRIVWNLVSNAVRYTDEGFVRISLDYQQGWLQLEVADSGIGIPKQFQKRLFKPYVKLPTQRSGGTGLGLSSAKTLVTLMKGRIRLASEPGQGTRVSVSLPAQVCARDDTLTAGRRLLIVDDDPGILQSLADVLGQLGVDYDTADSVAAARRMIGGHSYDLVLCDVNLGDGDICQVAAALSDAVRLIPMSADYSAVPDARRYRDRLYKPFDIQQLKRKIREFLDE